MLIIWNSHGITWNRSFGCLKLVVWFQRSISCALLFTDIDCGEPEVISGAEDYRMQLNNSTIYGQTFEVQCLPLFTVDGQSSLGNTTVTCLNSSIWGFNTLRCLGKFDGVLVRYIYMHVLCYGGQMYVLEVTWWWKFDVVQVGPVLHGESISCTCILKFRNYKNVKIIMAMSIFLLFNTSVCLIIVLSWLPWYDWVRNCEES